MSKKVATHIVISVLLISSLVIFYFLVISPNEKSKKEVRDTQQEKVLEKIETVEEIKEQESEENEVVFCTQDVRKCPDGSFVGRVPPKCEFAPCKDPINIK